MKPDMLSIKRRPLLNNDVARECHRHCFNLGGQTQGCQSGASRLNMPFPLAPALWGLQHSCLQSSWLTISSEM